MDICVLGGSVGEYAHPTRLSLSAFVQPNCLTMRQWNYVEPRRRWRDTKDPSTNPHDRDCEYKHHEDGYPISDNHYPPEAGDGYNFTLRIQHAAKYNIEATVMRIH